MPDNPVSIKITHRLIHQKLFGLTIPFFSYRISTGNYSLPDGLVHANQGGYDPYECLTSLLVNAELNRTGRQIGPIHGTFELIGDEGAIGLCLEKMLEMYARSENTTVTFEYKIGNKK